ncbi:TIGR00153 family protein [Oceanicoccus sagamiensis]|uniref:TIGR00153 family protein n=1 Tax=Oceanicoccus sagamiensis TaxID=716816 RepID=A0A1X9N727_9GAMM|nr:TIGR00153 family protein [Oceanicoccus sagamiensis]ARN73900.1 TIGR00153 family protein [Oceanicoccus sagamiensis]
MAGNPFGNLFGQSPIRPIQEHMATAHSCATHLSGYFEAVIAGDWDKAKEIQKQISKLEGDADKLKKQVRLNMPKSLFMPVPRSDLLDLVTMQDKIANCTKDIAGIMLGRKMAIPEKMAPIMAEYVQEAVATSAQALKAIQEMDELLETGFRGREVKVVEDLIKELDRLENKNDKLQVKVRAMLFKLEKDLPPVDVMFLYKIIDWVGELADRAQKVGSRLERLLAS